MTTVPSCCSLIWCFDGDQPAIPVAVPHGRRDVLIHPEQVRRVVFLLECSQPLVVGPISGPDPALALVTEIVHIGALLQKWLHGAVAGASPRDVVVRRRRVTPCSQHEATMLCASMAECGVPLADPAHRPHQLLDRPEC